jgi:ParB/RepB/Spo0J family partition protein
VASHPKNASKPARSGSVLRAVAQADEISHSPAGIQTSSWEEVALADIDREDLAFQYRFPSEIATLRLSLEAEGQREPIDLLGKKPYRIVDGFRRIAAATALRWETIKAFVHRDVSEEEAYRIAFTKNVVRRNLSPLERAQAILVAMKKRGLKISDLDEAFGISEKQVKRYLELLKFPDSIQKILDGEVVTMAHARALAKYGVGDDADKWRRRIQSDHLDARVLVRLLTEEKGKRPIGRPKRYMKREGDRVRMYGFLVGKDSSKEEKERVVKLLRDVIDLLEE